MHEQCNMNTQAHLDSSLVLNWTGRSQRIRKPPPKTYWEEYVATDNWYLRELMSDIPAEELHAALECEEWDVDLGEEGDDPADVAESTHTDDYSEAYVSDDASESGSEGSSESDSPEVDSEDTASTGHSPHSSTDTSTEP